MLATFRRSLTKWPARIFFLLLACAFGLWGVSGKIDLTGHASPVEIGGESIELAQLQDAYRREVAQVQRSQGAGDLTPQQRRAVALQATERLVTQVALQQAIRGLGVAVPDDALRQAVFDMPAFRGQDGQFDRNVMTGVLRNNGLSEQRFLDMMRDDLGQRQVLGAVRAGAAAPSVLADQVFAIQQEKRVAQVVEVPLIGDEQPPTPTDLQLQRWWANHPEHFSTPEYRRIKAIVLSPETLEKSVEITEDDLKASFEQHKTEFNKPERRSVQVILTQDEAQAQALAARWTAGADWTEMQAEAGKAGAAPVELDDASLSEFPAPELGAAVFASAENTVPPPVHSALGWHVLKVIKISGGLAQKLDDVRDAVHARVLADKAADLIYDRANRIENLLSSGTTLDNLPGDLDVAAASGTLDAQGFTQKGEPAPIPGPAELRPALIQAVFAAKAGDPPKLVQAPNGANGAQSFFAFSVDEVIPPAQRPFADVVADVRSEWIGDQIRRGREEVAAQMLAAVKGGQTLDEAAAKAGLTARLLPATGQASPAEGVPSGLLGPLFALKKGEATMIETQQGFLVAVLNDIQLPDPKADPIGYGQVKDALSRAVGEDIQTLFATAVRQRAKPRVSQAAVDSLTAGGAGGE